MSATSHVTIWCDAEDCNAWTDHGMRSATDTRQQAKREGWRVAVPDRSRQPGNNAQLDYCPEHARAHA